MGDSVDKTLNLIKLCVGAERVEDLTDWQANPRAKGPDGLPRHVTRMWPKRAEEVLAGDLDGAVAELRGRGVEVTDPSPVGTGRQSFLHDPSGNRIELHQPG